MMLLVPSGLPIRDCLGLIKIMRDGFVFTAFRYFRLCRRLALGGWERTFTHTRALTKTG
jgi:hypothetical protein